MDLSGDLSDDSMSSLQEEPSWGAILECPVCFDKIIPPIYQCAEGHMVCNNCRPNCRNCPTCRGPLGNIRNRALERCLSKVKMPCPNAEHGCQMKVALAKMKAHTAQCECRPYKCPRSRSNCTWEGKLEDVRQHLIDRHGMKVVNGSYINETYSNPEGIRCAVWEGPIILTANATFIIHFEQRASGQYATFVRFIGSRKDAKKFTYHLRVTRNGRSLRWDGVPRSIRSTAAKVMEVNDCLILEKNMALYFSESGGDGSGSAKNLSVNIQGGIEVKELEPQLASASASSGGENDRTVASKKRKR